MKIASYDIVFQDVPGEVTLSLNLSQCPNRCPGCHSPMLQDDIGLLLDDDMLDGLLERYGHDVTCVCFMGGDGAPHEVAKLSDWVRTNYNLKTGWYSGKDKLADESLSKSFDYIKIGPYIPERGPLKDPNTNQRLYKIADGKMEDITCRFWRNHKI